MSGQIPNAAIFGKLVEPLTRLVINNLHEALKRIKNIKFLPEQVAIELIAGNVSTRGSIMILQVVLEGENAGFPFKAIFRLTEEYRDGFVDFDKDTDSIILSFPGVNKITFSDGTKSYSFCKQKSDR